MSPNFTFNYPPCPVPCSTSTPGNFVVRAWYFNMQDTGHLYGTFTTRERAEECVKVLASRSDVQKVTIETGV